MFRLILRFQDTVLDELTFEGTPVTIGRRDSNDVVIDNMAVSGGHAVIQEPDPGTYVLVDQDSLNGTFLNDKKVIRENLFHGDVIIIGKHQMEFVDLRPEELRPTREVEEESRPPGPQFRETVILDTQEQEELMAKQERDKGISPEDAAAKPRKVELFGSLTVVAGGTPEIIDLTKRLTTLGKGNDTDVKCSGLLVGKNAAVINKRPTGFFIAYAEGMKRPEVNGETVQTQRQLHDGDEITIGNTRMTFNQREEIS